ncbi:MAG: hypothetical protein K5669_07075 [Lachnospiraceae bacterium]|nr:hypothetical protein [Lachnospiraceae bacterium]
MKKEKRALTEGQVEKLQAVKDTLKSLIFPLILVAVIAIAVYLIIHFVNPVAETEPVAPYGYSGEGEAIVVESDDLVFTMDPTTTLFTVEQKSTGKIWNSYITDAESDGVALGNEKARMQSNVILSYAVTNGLETVFDSKSFSVDKGIYEIKTEGNTVKVFYSLGNVEREYVIPTVIRATDFEAYLEQMESSYKSAAKDFYKKYDINKLKKSDDKTALLENYPILETEPIYVLRDTVTEVRKQKLEDGFASVGYTYDLYLADKELDLSSSTSDNPVFNMEMDFTVDGNELIVEVPFDSIEYDPQYPVYTVTPLPYFGAGSKEDTGFVFVPEGGGAVINYNNGKTSQSDYYANVYGWDMDLRRDYVIHNTRAYFNVFGQSCDDSSYICIMEDGSSYGAVQASVSGKANSYNFVDAKYSLCSREKYNIGEIANSDVYAYLTGLPEGEKIVQRYCFIDSSDYVDMAYAYRGYLEEKYGQYMSLNTDTQAPVSVEIVGAIDKVQQVVGVPVSLPLKLTTFDEATEIIKDLDSQNIGNLSVKLTGWCNGGVNQKLLKNIRLVSALGSKKDLNELSKTAKDLGVELYLDGITQYAHRSNIFNGFFSYRDAARLLTKERAELYRFSHITYKAREGFKSYYLLHTPLAMKMADNLVDEAVKYGTGVSFQDIGMDLSSDFYRKDYHSREKTKSLNEELLKTLDDRGANLMINMGNDYAVPYADMVTNMELKGSGYTIIDAEVPFYQIAIHGYIDYTGNPINICGNDEEELLRSVEYGAGLNFTIMKESSFVLQKTLYPEYYGSEYASWRDRMIEMCSRYNTELGNTFNQEMTDHEVINDYVRSTSYADGTTVYVNYSFSDEYTAPDGTVVGPRDYAVAR